LPDADQTCTCGGVSPVTLSRTFVNALLAVAVAVAFADASIVVLAVPEIMDDFDVGVKSASWVVTAYNLAVVVTGIVLIWLVRRVRVTTLAAAGFTVCGLASLGCALTQSIWPLVILRGVQGVGAAALLVASLPLLQRTAGGARLWILAATVGTAAGPALGGLLTEFFSWRSIFIVQAPLIAVGVVALAGASLPPVTVERLLPERPKGFALAALAALSAALVGVLFLVIVLLVAGLEWSPLPAALVATTLPVLAFVADRLARGLPEVPAAAGGCVLVAGGLATLAFLPDDNTALIVAGLALCGVGLGLASHPLGERAFGHPPTLADGNRVVVLRHAGLVVGLIVVVALLASALDDLRSRAEVVTGKTMLEAPLPLETKVPLMLELAAAGNPERAKPPDVEAIFARHGAASNPALQDLQDQIVGEVEELVIRTFRKPFLVCALFALLAGGASLGIGTAREEARSRRTVTALAVAAAAGVALIAVDVALGAFDDPVDSADPCNSPITLNSDSGPEAALQQAALAALSSAACNSGTSGVDVLRRALSGDTSSAPGLPPLPPGLLPPGGPPIPSG
jgi:MFS family permease